MSDGDTTNANASTTQHVLWPERWIKKRYGLMLLAALLLWPFVGLVPSLESLVVNGLLIDRYWQLSYLTITNVVAFFFAVSILRVLGARNRGGKISMFLFGDSERPWGRTRVIIVTSIAAFAPLFIALKFGSEFSGYGFLHVCKSMATVGISAVAGVVGLWVLGFVKCWIFGSYVDSANTFPFESRSAQGLTFLRKVSQTMERYLIKMGFGNTDLQFLAYLGLLAMVHHQLARWLENNEYWLTSAPYMLVLFVWLMFMILAGLANWLDRWRIPALIVFVLAFSILLSFRGSVRLLNSYPDNSINRYVEKIRDIRSREDELLENGGTIPDRKQLIAHEMEAIDDATWAAVKQRMKNLEQLENKKGKTLVIVTCPGGGIHAAAWASCVLDQLSDEYVEFKDSLCVISGVSGGSVGTLLFVGSRYESELLERVMVSARAPSTEEVHRDLKSKSPALELSSRSALEAIAFGSTVDDLYGLIGINGQGRGQRLEDSLKTRLSTDLQTMTMGQWGDRSLSGSVPIVIFNSTDAVTGRRILFDTVPTPWRASSVGLTARPLNYRELLDTSTQAHDVLPATAARTSATFPYISPFTKPSKPSDIGDHVALCDGGYVDNEGIVTAVNWIEFLLRKRVDDKAFDRILLLRIEPAFVEDKNQPAEAGGLMGALRWISGPIETMANVRSSSQLERGNLEADLAALNLTVSKKQGSDSEQDTEPPLLGMKFSGERALPQNVVDLPAFDKRKLSAQDIRKNWEQMLDEYNDTGNLPKTASQTETPKAIINDPNQAIENEPLVDVQTIRFIDANQSIPLNWKLSNRQKLGYLLAWELCSAEGTPLRKTLDRYFNRADRGDE